MTTWKPSAGLTPHPSACPKSPEWPLDALLAEKPGGPAGVAITCNGIYSGIYLTDNKRIVVAMYWEYHGYISILSI